MTRAAMLAPAVAAALCVVPRAMCAQHGPPTAWARPLEASSTLADVSAAWLSAWSPLRPLIEAPRSALRAPLAPGLLDAPPPAAGAFVLAGAAGAIARDFGRNARYAQFGEITARASAERGEFHRPLDAARSSVSQVAAQGWAWVGERTVAIGRFALDREENDPSAFTARITPYTSSPITMTDSVRPPMVRSRAKLEGALGAEFAGFGLGLAAGVVSREHNSVDFPLRRTGRAAIPSLNVGAERELPWLGLRLGTYYRWSEHNETNILNPKPLPTLIYAIQGYDEPFGLQVTSQQGNVMVRNDRRANALGFTAEATVLGAVVVVTRESGGRDEEQTRAPFSETRAIERWSADGSEIRAQVQREFGRRLIATLVLADESLDGRGERSDLEGIAFNGKDSRRAIEADLRAYAGRGWSAALLGGVIERHHGRNDFAAQLASDLNWRVLFVGGEVAREFDRIAVAAGMSAAAQVPMNSVIPRVDTRGTSYKRLIAPELAYELAEARARAFWATVNVPVGRSTVFLRVRTERTAPRAPAEERLQPAGARSAWSVLFGVRP